MRHRQSLLPTTLPLLLACSLAAQDGASTFGHARARELADLGRLPTAAEIVVRDIVNYHRHRLPLPSIDRAIAVEVRRDLAAAQVGDEVWLQFGYTTAPQGDRALAPPAAVALVVDTSGSMADAGKLDAVQRGLRAFVERLRPDDEVALVTFATDAAVRVPLQRRGDGRWLRDAIDALRPDGNTNLHAGLMQGLDQLGKATDSTRQRRLVVLTDGIANQGVTDPSAIIADAQRRAERTVDISTIGVGQSLDVPLLQRLAHGCRGLFHFVADGRDVQKVFVAEADAMLGAVARGLQFAIELERGLQVVQVLHEGARVLGNRVEIDLPDANAGLTAVVMMRCRVVDPGLDHLVVRADLKHTPVANGIATADGALILGRSALLRGMAYEPPAQAIDVEVRKNAAIAVIGQGLADMAVQCDARRWADADRALQRATAEAVLLFPGNDDDVQRVRDIVAGHRQTLRRYVDRFREF
ncbi:MAG: VWA domain-containing protein [Planctomycetes bacterium]|nr:VWA domain-containing protein [Planctomycetota bacterium]